MKKLTKLNLNDLKVESFVTSLKNESSNTVKGGTGGIVGDTKAGAGNTVGIVGDTKVVAGNTVGVIVVLSAIGCTTFACSAGTKDCPAPANDTPTANNTVPAN